MGVASDLAVDAPGRIETRGIDFIQANERHGRPLELFWVWFAANLSYLYVLFGGLLILFGLTLAQALVVIFVGNLFYALVGVIATAGPTFGTSTVNISRTMFGSLGNKVLSALPTWVLAVAFEAINLSVGALAGFALLGYFGMHVGAPAKVITLVVIATGTFGLSILGHATIVRANGALAGLLALAAVVLFGFTVSHAKFGYTPAHPAHGLAAFGTIFIGLTLIASGPLTWVSFPADFARYLPRGTSRRAVAWWTAAGGYLSSSFLAVVGVLAGTAVDMTDPQTSMKAIVPGWFYPLFLGLIIVGTILNNVLGIYTSGLALQALGVPYRRSRTVIFDCIVGGAMTVYAIFVSDFLTTLNSFLTLSEVWLAPFAGVFVSYLLINRRRLNTLENGAARLDITTVPPVLLPGVLGVLVGAVLAFLCADTSYWHGPVSTALSGADLAPYVGFLSGAGVFLAAQWILAVRATQPNDAQGAPVAAAVPSELA